jgi:hypothetical protein
MVNETDSAVGFVPAVPPPPGIDLDPNNPDRSLQTKVLITAIIFPLIALIFTILRLYSAKFILGRFHLDDCTGSRPVTRIRRANHR